jgi:lysophospholipase L1-like esterase
MINLRRESTSGSRCVRANAVLTRSVLLIVPSLVLAVIATAGANAHPGVAAAGPTAIAAQHPDIQYLGRWGRLGQSMTTVNSGSQVVLRFTGRHLAATFNQSTVTHPPQIYVRVDGRAPALYTVDRNRLDLTSRPLAPGQVHTLEIAVKDVDERANRWNPPLQSGLLLTGFRLDRGARTLPPPAPSNRRIEFLGDSITQGVRTLGPEIGVTGSDATKDYAWLTGRALRVNFRQVGFGAQGILRPGGGQVPTAGEALRYNFAGSPIDPSYVPQAVVVNQGTNDALNAVDPVRFQAAYLNYLRRIRATWPTAWIFAMRPLGGYLAREITGAVAAANDAHIVYVDTTGWLTATEYQDGLHPTYAGHLQVARRLAPLVATRLGWSSTEVRNSRVELLAAGAAPGFESTTAPGWAPGAYVSTVAVGAGDGVSAARPYDGQAALQATSTVAPLGQWRTISLRPGTRLRVPPAARDLFVYISPNITASFLYDVRLTVTQGRRTLTDQAYGLPHITPLIPWNRLHVNLAGNQPITGITVSVRVEGTPDSGRLSFQIDDVGWTDIRDG